MAGINPTRPNLGRLGSRRIVAPDDLSGWTLPPPGALDSGEIDLLRVFDTAEAAMAFLARHGGAERLAHIATGFAIGRANTRRY